MKVFRGSVAAAFAVSVVSVAVMAAIAVREIGKSLEGVMFHRDDAEPDPVVEFARDVLGLDLTDWQERFLADVMKGRDA